MSPNSSPFAARQGLDDQVVLRLTQGDAEARRDIVEGTAATLYRRALRLAADPALAKTWLQESYREGVAALASGAAAPDGADAFLTRVLLERSARALAEGPPPAATGNPLASPALVELGTWLADLSPAQRLVLVMRELETLPEPEAAPLLAFLGVPLEETLAQALEVLAARAGEEGPEGVTRAFDNFRVATATPMRPRTEELVPPAESLPPPAPLRDTGVQAVMAAKAAEAAAAAASSGGEGPTFGEGQPTFGERQPAFGEGQPTFGEREPTFGEGQPTFGETSLRPSEPGFTAADPSTPSPASSADLSRSTEADSADDEFAAAFDDALGPAGAPKRTRSSGEMPAVNRANEDVHDWYLGVDEQQLGPMKKSGVRELWREGRVGPDSLAWREGLPDWLALSRIVEFMDILGEPTTDAPHPPLPAKASPLALSALVQQELSAITATAVTEPPKKVPPIAAPVRRTQSLLALSSPPSTSELPAASPESPAPAMPPEDLQATQPAPHAPLPEPVVPSPRVVAPRRSWFLPAALVLVLLDLGLALLVGLVTLRRPHVVYVPVATEAPPAVAPPSAPLGVNGGSTAPAAVAAPSSVPAPSSVTASSDVAAPSTPLGVNGNGNGAKPQPTNKVTSLTSPAASIMPGSGPTKVASVGNRAQNDKDFDKLFKSDKPPPAPPPPPAKHEVYVPPAPGKAPLMTKLSTADMMSTVLDHKPAIEACAREQGHQKPNLHGTLVMKFTIAPSGKVTSVVPSTDPYKKTYLARCLAKEISRWKFLKHQQQGEPVPFPFKF